MSIRGITKQIVTVIIEANFPQLREYCPRAFGTWAIFPQLREISLTIDLDASHHLHSIKLLTFTSSIRQRAPCNIIVS